MWTLNAVIVHVVLLGSIFVIYFTSPVLRGLRPQQLLPLSAPADRLVLIVTDGLRAESFFRDHCADIPHLRDLLHLGVVGISRTRVPTESRPGHIALIAGMYEDPSAVTRGWKTNPIDFDTVFNRSGRTFAWGANDVLHIFSRLGGAEGRFFADVYDTDLDFSGRTKTYELDNWVFERVRALLQRKGDELRTAKRVIFFLHLLGLDSAGHIHKPGSALFLENLHSTERGVVEIVKQFEAAFPDNRTSFVLTSDHGMTNSGSHGSGDPMETETPFFLWGAGISSASKTTNTTFHISESVALPLHELEQAQLAPLMSALLGLPPPMNNFGILPIEHLEASDEYKAHAMFSNALQLLEQFKMLALEHQRGMFTPFMRQFRKLSVHSAAEYEQTTKTELTNGKYAAVINASYQMMSHTLQGIDYYNRYYQNGLLVSTTLSFAGWLYYLLHLLFQSVATKIKTKRKRAMWPHSKLLYAISGVVLTFIVLQRVPFMTAIYFVLPIFVWTLAVREYHALQFKWKSSIVVEAFLLILCIELLVLTFFDRRFIALAFVILTIVNNLNAPAHRGARFYVWLMLAVALVIVPLLPSPLGYQNIYLHLLGIAIIFARSQFAKWRMPVKMKIMPLTAMLNACICAYQHEHQIGISFVSQCISWSFLLYVCITIAYNRALALKQRVEFICFHLSVLYTLFCTSYESIFVLLITTELVFSLRQHVPGPKLDVAVANVEQFRASVRLAFTVLLYTLISFFGVGNIASISSFDPNIIRCFLTTFSPFTIMFLVILKLLIPLILIISILYGVAAAFIRNVEQQVFICLLLICDVMCLNFLFLVRNQGSWLEIGSSISHFVIMEVTTLVLVLLTQIVKLLLRLHKIK